ncbi:MAG TPA: AAA family ATPase [Acetobacteraceae bacterium]
MQISSIELHNWLPHRYLSLAFQRMTLIVGPNGSGKSAIGDAIAYVMIGELRRITAKGDRGKLITEGADGGDIVLTCEDTAIARDIATGKLQSRGRLPIPPTAVTEAVPYLLDRSRFGAAGPDERRKLLRAVMRADLGPEAILAVMRERKHPQDKLDHLKPEHTLDEWVALADRCATEARGAWRAVTGTAYGTDKASSYVVPGPAEPATPEDVAGLDAEVSTLSQEVGMLHRELGALDAADARTSGTSARMANLKELADSAPAVAAAWKATRKKLDAAIASRDLAKTTLADLDARAADDYFTCPGCRTPLQLVKDNLEPYEEPDNPSSPADRAEARAALALAQGQMDGLSRTLLAHTSQRDAASAAAESILLIDPKQPVDQPNHAADGSRGDIQAQLAQAQGDLDAKSQELREARDSLAAERAATAATERATAYHRDVLHWLAIKAALAPDGIPGELLQAVLGPFNRYLSAQADATGWPRVAIGADMGITVGGRPYALMSRSEWWRSDAMIGAALAVTSDLGFLLLDEFDLLDLPSRGPAMAWLYQLGDSGDLDSVIVMATMKAPPTAPAGVAVHWLGDTLPAARVAGGRAA